MTFRILPVLLLLAFAGPVGKAQSAVSSVCELLDNAQNDQVVVVRALAWSHIHGAFLSDRLSGDPCPGWRTRILTAPSALPLTSSPNAGVRLTAEQKRLGWDFLLELRSFSRRNPGQPLPVTITGAIVRKSSPMIFRRADGEYWGNGFGPSGGFPAVLVIQSAK